MSKDVGCWVFGHTRKGYPLCVEQQCVEYEARPSLDRASVSHWCSGEHKGIQWMRTWFQIQATKKLEVWLQSCWGGWEREECRLWKTKLVSMHILPATEPRPGEGDGQGQCGISRNLTKLFSCCSGAPQAPLPWARVSPRAWGWVLSLWTEGH